LEKSQIDDVCGIEIMSDSHSNESSGNEINFELMSQLVDENPGLSDEEILKLYQLTVNSQQSTIALLSDHLTEQTKLMLASALPSAKDPKNTNSQAQYRIDERIDSGGQSHVYLAHRDDGTYEKTVVIKVLNQSIEGETQKNQMMAEMQILADLKHPNIVTILDAGIDEQDRPWLMLEYIKGQHIDQYVKNNKLKQREIAELIRLISQALRYIHNLNIAHLDIKPANILIEEIDGMPQPVIIDFGIAMTQNIEAVQTPYIFATPAFAAPEQLEQHHKPDQRSDIYSLGKVFNHLLLISQNQQASNTSVLHPDLNAIITHCTQPEPDKRYQSTQQIINDLKSFSQNDPVSVRSLNWWQNLQRVGKKRPWIPLISVMCLLVLVLIINNYKDQYKREQLLLSNAKQSQAYWQAADDIYNQTRLIYALPKRSIEPDLNELNQRYKDLSHQFKQESEDIQSLAHHAMAKAANSLGIFDDAHDHLLRAHQTDPENLEIRHLLIKSYLQLYQRESAKLQNFAETAQRQILRDRLQQKYFQPAIALLQQADFSNEQGIILSSLLLHFEQQSAQALQQLTDKETSELWPIEQYLLVAEIARDMAAQQINDTEIESALSHLKQAKKYLSKAQSIARSHPEVHQRLCQTESQIAQLSPQNQTQQISSCEDLLVILPATDEVTLLVANAYAQLAKSWLDFGRTPLPLLKKVNDLLTHQTDVNNDEAVAWSKQISGHVFTIQGLWEMYSNQDFESSLMEAVNYHQQAAQFQANNYNAQFELAMAWFNLANYVESERAQKIFRFEQAIEILERLTKHADATILTTAKLVRFYTEYAYQSYQQGYSADQPLNAADHLVQQTLQSSADNTYTHLAAATLYWTYTDYLVLINQNPEPYLQQAIDLFEKVINENADWTHRFNQISAMLSGATYYLKQGQIQTEALKAIEIKLKQLAESVSDDINLNSHLGYFYNLMAMNLILQEIDPIHAIEQAQYYNQLCLNSPIDGRTCYSQLATTLIIEQQWKVIKPDYVMLQNAATMQQLNDGLEKYPKHHLLEAQLGQLQWLSSLWQNLSQTERQEVLQQAHQHLSNALTHNRLLKYSFAEDLKAIETKLGQAK
jgi:serine/threonine protein kinase